VSGSDEAFVQMILGGLTEDRHVLIQAHARKLDGTEFPAEIAVNRLRLTRRPQLCFLFRDISERAAAQNQLRIEHRAIQNAGSAVAITDPAGRFVYANPALFRMWEIDPARTALADLTLDRILADAADRDRIMAAVTRGEACAGEVSAVRSDGRTFLVAISAAADVVEGEIEGLIFSFADIDARRRAEETLRDYQVRLEDMIGERTRELREAVARLQDHNREKSEFVSNVSHELRTPLTSMAYATDNLLSGMMGPLPPAVRTYLSMIRDDCNRLTRTVNDILDLSRIEARRLVLDRRRIPLSRFVKDCARPFYITAHELGQQFRVEAPHIGFAAVDLAKLERALANVIHNATKYTPANGAITVSIDARGDDPCPLRIIVCDDGPGIAPDHLPHVMERYYRADEQAVGTGLGLALCKEVVALHEGSVTIESPVPGAERGTRVVIALPRAAAPVLGFASCTDRHVAVVRQVASQDRYTLVELPVSGNPDAKPATTPDLVLVDAAGDPEATLTALAGLIDAPAGRPRPLLVLTGKDTVQSVRDVATSMDGTFLPTPVGPETLARTIEDIFMQVKARLIPYAGGSEVEV
jgi:signal transduction histidine kinase